MKQLQQSYKNIAEYYNNDDDENAVEMEDDYDSGRTIIVY